MILSRREVLSVLVLARRAGGGQPLAEPSSDDLLRCRRAVEIAPTVRKERVAAIRKALDTANYRIDAGEVANKMIERSLVDAFIWPGGPWSVEMNGLRG